MIFRIKKLGGTLMSKSFIVLMILTIGFFNTFSSNTEPEKIIENYEGFYIGLGYSFVTNAELSAYNFTFSENTSNSSFLKLEYYDKLKPNKSQFGYGFEFNLSEINIENDGGAITDMITYYIGGRYFQNIEKGSYYHWKIGKISELLGDPKMTFYVKTDIWGNPVGTEFAQLDGKLFYSFGSGYKTGSGFIELSFSSYNAQTRMFVYGMYHTVDINYSKTELSYSHKF
jgi:hypothetical protein